MRAAVLAVLLLAPVVHAAGAPAVALIVRDGAWAHGDATLAVDGAPVAVDDLDATLRARLAGPSPVALSVEAHEGGLRVRATSAVEVPAVLAVAFADGDVVREEARARVALAPGRDASAAFEGAGDGVVWVEVADDATGRFRAAEVLQAWVLGEGSAAKTVLLEARRCATCGEAEAAARAAASAYAGGLPERAGYVRAPTLPEAALAIVLVGAAVAVLVPRRLR